MPSLPLRQLNFWSHSNSISTINWLLFLSAASRRAASEYVLCSLCVSVCNQCS